MSTRQTLADHLRGFSDHQLAALLRARPDLANPVPGDFGALAARAHSPISIARAIEELTAFELAVLDVLRLADQHGMHRKELDSWLTPYFDNGLSAQAVTEALQRLGGLALTWGDDPLRAPGALTEVLGPNPLGLGRPAAELTSANGGTPHTDPTILTLAPEPARAIAERLAVGPPVGEYRVDNPGPAVQWLIEHDVLGVEDNHVELPRELGLALRGDTPLGALSAEPPTVVPASGVSDAAAVGTAAELLRLVERALVNCDKEPITGLRSGGVGLKEQRRIATELGTDLQTVALLLHISHSAGLLGLADRWLPTPAFDAWREAHAADRWLRLVTGWLAMPALPSLVGAKDGNDNKRLNALASDVGRVRAPALRRMLLETMQAHATTQDSLLELLSWEHPRIVQLAGRSAFAGIWDEIHLIGLAAGGTLTSYAVAILNGETARAHQELATALPAPVDHVLIQPDLTVVAPGPLPPTVSSKLELFTELESAGAATVYRITPAGLRRAVRNGMAVADIEELLRGYSRTPLPQTLTYLLTDVARHAGGLRLGSAGCYIRADDQARLAALVADRKLAALRLRLIAPTVAVSPLPAYLVADLLGESEHEVWAEDGATFGSERSAQRRRAQPASTTTTHAPPSSTDEELTAAIARLRRGDAATTVHVDAAGPQQDMDTIMTVAQVAIRDKRSVTVGYVSPHGDVAGRTVIPVSLGGGYLRAEDPRAESTLMFALHRVAWIKPGK